MTTPATIDERIRPQLPLELRQPEAPEVADWSAWIGRPDFRVLLFDAGIDVGPVDRHVTDIMFDPQARPEPDCLLCVAGVALGIWAHWEPDNPDPFNTNDESHHQ